MADEPGPRERTIDPWVFWPAGGVVLAFAGFAIVAPGTADAMFSAVQAAIIGNLNWYYVLLVAFFVAFVIGVGVSRYGDIRLGRDDDEPEFSLGSWFALLFAAGMGIGLVFYGVSEPLSHFVDPRPGVSGSDAQLGQQALTQTYLHWGVHAWSIYVVIGLALAYAIHRRGRPLAIRWALEPLLGRRVQGGLGDAIDVVALVGTMFGVATSLGLGVLQISSGLSVAQLFQATTPAQIVLIAVITGFVLFSVVSGVNRGMKWLSNANLGLAGVLVLVLLVLGPTVFLLRELVQSIGTYLQNFIGLTFTTSAFTGAEGEAWQAEWTSFYWGWWISWAPFVGIFIARISRGRTVRQFVAGIVLVPTLIGILWFSVLGGSALAMQLSGTVDFRGPDGEVDLQAALFQLLAELPGGAVLSVGAILLIVIFFVTSADSGSLVMAMIATGGNADPPRRVRVFFVLATSTLAIALLLGGGLDALQTAAILIALPFSIVLLLIAWSTAIAFGREHRAYERAQRAQLMGRIGEYYGLEVESRDDDGAVPRRRRRWRDRLRRRRGFDPF